MSGRDRFEINGLAWPHRCASALVTTTRGILHVQRLGHGPLILLIHGTGSSTHTWEGLIDRLSNTFELVAVDLPGQGFSAPVPSREMTPLGLARCLEALLDRLAIVPQLVVGHSAGAAIAVRMTADARVTAPHRIIAINGALQPFGGLARLLFAPAARLLAVGSLPARLLARRAEQASTVERLLAGTGGHLPARSIEFYRCLFAQPQHVQATLDMMANWSLDGLPELLARLPVPLELIACGEDLAVPAESAWDVKNRARDASVHYLRGLGHLGHEERPDLMAEIIRAAACRAGLIAGPAPRPAKGAQTEPSQS
jgi:magnesium chelatase accessory protein